MAEQLYPVFDIPSMDDKEDESGVIADDYYWPGPLFDFTKGDFAVNGANQCIMVDGYDEYMIWVMKCIRTQVGSCQSYPEFGIDLEGSLQEPSREGIETALEKTIIEGLSRNPRTERVHSFDITFDGDSISVYFIVQPKDQPAFDMTMNIVQ